MSRAQVIAVLVEAINKERDRQANGDRTAPIRWGAFAMILDLIQADTEDAWLEARHDILCVGKWRQKRKSRAKEAQHEMEPISPN